MRFSFSPIAWSHPDFLSKIGSIAESFDFTMQVSSLSGSATWLSWHTLLVPPRTCPHATWFFQVLPWGRDMPTSVLLNSGLFVSKPLIYSSMTAGSNWSSWQISPSYNYSISMHSTKPRSICLSPESFYWTSAGFIPICLLSIFLHFSCPITTTTVFFVWIRAIMLASMLCVFIIVVSCCDLLFTAAVCQLSLSALWPKSIVTSFLTIFNLSNSVIVSIVSKAKVLIFSAIAINLSVKIAI